MIVRAKITIPLEAFDGSEGAELDCLGLLLEPIRKQYPQAVVEIRKTGGRAAKYSAPVRTGTGLVSRTGRLHSYE